ncbi:MAG TPA: hypothetical protein VJ499_00165 [Flavisolibacter sp.]|nr:hypothetical protein [Flavisolibacter sp.]
MRIYLIIVALLLLNSCEPAGFGKDKRQLMAKDEIRARLPIKSSGFDITDFSEDTLHNWPDSNIKMPLLYTLGYTYKDSSGTEHHEKGSVVFTPDGRSIIQTKTGDSSLIH